MNVINTTGITRSKWSKNDYKYMAIGYDDEFKELLEDINARNEELAEKYKSFAWFNTCGTGLRFAWLRQWCLQHSSRQARRTVRP
jgi:hypothetical protein